MRDRVVAVAALRGGNWNNGSNAGVFALNLNNVPANANNNIGFRLGKRHCQTLDAYGLPNCALSPWGHHPAWASWAQANT